MAALSNEEPSVYDEAWAKSAELAQERDQSEAGWDEARDRAYAGKSIYENVTEHGLLPTGARMGINLAKGAYEVAGAIPAMIGAGVTAVEDLSKIAYPLPPEAQAKLGWNQKAIGEHLAQGALGLGEAIGESVLGTAKNVYNWDRPEQPWLRFEQLQESPIETVLNTTGVAAAANMGLRGAANLATKAGAPGVAGGLTRAAGVAEKVAAADPFGAAARGIWKGGTKLGELGVRAVTAAKGGDTAAAVAKYNQKLRILFSRPDELLNTPFTQTDGTVTNLWDASANFRNELTRRGITNKMMAEMTPEDKAVLVDDVLRMTNPDIHWWMYNDDYIPPIEGAPGPAVPPVAPETPPGPAGKQEILGPEEPTQVPLPGVSPRGKVNPDLVPPPGASGAWKPEWDEAIRNGYADYASNTVNPVSWDEYLAEAKAKRPQDFVDPATVGQNAPASAPALSAAPEPTVEPVVPPVVEPAPVPPEPVLFSRPNKRTVIADAAKAGDVDTALKTAGLKPTPANPEPLADVAGAAGHEKILSDALDSARNPATTPRPPVSEPVPAAPAPSQAAPPPPPAAPATPRPPIRKPMWINEEEARAAAGMKVEPVYDAEGNQIGRRLVPMTPEDTAQMYSGPDADALRDYHKWIREKFDAPTLAKGEFDGVYSVEMPGADFATVVQRDELRIAGALRKYMIQLGAEAVSEGLLSEAVFFGRIGEYEPDLYKQYLAHKLNLAPDDPQILERWNRYKSEALKMQGDRLRYAKLKHLDVDLREALGMIRDPRVSIAHGLDSLIHDIEMAKLQRNLATATMPDGTPFAPREPSGAKTVKLTSANIRGPKYRKFGQLENRHVTPEEAHYINAMHKVPGSVAKTYLKWMRKWKMGMTTLNPVSMLRNTVGAMYLLVQEGSDPFTSPSARRALRSGVTRRTFKPPVGDEYAIGGGARNTFADVELGKDFANLAQRTPESGANILEMAMNQAGRLMEAADKAGKFNRGVEAVGRGVGKAVGFANQRYWKFFTEKMTKAYSFPDEFARRLRFEQVRILQKDFERSNVITRDARRALGQDAERVLNARGPDAIREAMNQAYKVAFDYSNVSPFIEWTRRYWAPFITFQSKMLPSFNRFLVEHPLEAAFFQQWTRSMETWTETVDGEPLTDEQLDEIRRSKGALPWYMRPGAQFAGYNEEGKPKFTDMTGWNVMGGMLPSGWTGEEGIPKMAEVSNPLVGLGVAAVTGKQFPGEFPVVDPLTTSTMGKAVDWASFLSKQILPATFPGYPPIAGRMWQKAGAYVSGEPYFGRDMTAKDLFLGLREQAASPEEAARKVVGGYSAERGDIERAFRGKLKKLKPDQVEERQALIEQYQERRRQLIEQFQNELKEVR